MTLELADFPRGRQIRNTNGMKTILLIDNDPVSTIRISEIVQQSRRRFLHAPRAEQGGLFLRSEKPDLVIYHVPQNGQGTRDATQPAHMPLNLRGIPLLCILRGGRFPGPAPEILGPKQYLIDPFTRDELLSAVENHLKK